MKAAFHHHYTGPGGIAVSQTPVPVPKEDELLIKVHLCTFNRTDCANISANPWFMRLMMGINKPRKPISGTDFAGTVLKTGTKVSRFKEGDRVFGFDDSGLRSHAEYMCIKESKAIEKLNDTVKFDQAAASIEGSHYAINFINKVDMHEGQKVLVNGGTGAIGSAMIQLLVIKGLTVDCTARADHFSLMRELGVKKVFDYKETPITNITERYDFVFDSVGKSRFSVCKNLLRSKGVYISSEMGPNAENTYLSVFTNWSRQKVIFPFPVNPQRSLELIHEYLKDDLFKPLIDRIYSLDQINEAYQYVASGDKVGNVLIDPTK